MIRVLIADDHAIVRKGLKQIVAEIHDIKVIDEAGNGEEVLEKVENTEYDVVVLDISMPGMSGLDVLKILKERKPHLPVLILSIHSEEQYAVRTLKAGASGYLTKESAPDELIKALMRISTGKKYVTSTLAEKLVLNLEKDPEKLPHERLSNREYQVLCMMCSGKTLKDIAEKIFLSPKTVSTYRSRILSKMNMNNNAELILYALKHNLLN